jgi:hypothetical protein
MIAVWEISMYKSNRGIDLPSGLTKAEMAKKQIKGVKHGLFCHHWVSALREILSPLKIMPAGQLIGVLRSAKQRIYFGTTWHDCIIRIREDKEFQAEN